MNGAGSAVVTVFVEGTVVVAVAAALVAGGVMAANRSVIGLKSTAGAVNATGQ